jgi:heme exporter protein CcmD
VSHWPFILVAYALTLVAVCGLVGWSLVAMRRAEAEAEGLKHKE